MLTDDDLEKLTDLHIEVLKDILRGDPFEFIREQRKDEFERLNYEEIIIDKAHRLTFNKEGQLIGAYPVSPLPTLHKITVAGVGTGYAMCAIDALGATHTFGAPVSIESRTSGTGKTVELTVSADTVPSSDFVVTYNQLGYDNLRELVSANAQLATDACPSINFYESADRVPDGLEILTFEQAIKDSKAIFDRDAIRDHIERCL